MLMSQQYEALGQKLYESMMAGVPIPPLSDAVDKMDVDDAYNISLAFLQLRQTLNNEAVIGKKIGVTSKAVQDMLGVYQPDFGFLTDSMLVKNGVVDTGALISPRAEAEIAFCLKHSLKGPGVTPDDVLSATDYVQLCFEIVDSRIFDWRIKIQDTIADNASCGVFALGSQKIAPNALDLAKIEVVVTKNNKELSRGLGSAVQGAPQNAVAWLANTLGERGIPLQAGEIILSGSLVPLEPVVAGDEMSMRIDGFGECSVRFE